MKAFKYILNALELLNLTAALISFLAMLFLLSSLDTRIILGIAITALFFGLLAISTHLWERHQTKLFLSWLCFFGGLALVMFIHFLPVAIRAISKWF